MIPQRYALRLKSCWVCYQIAITADLCLSFKINGSIPFLVSRSRLWPPQLSLCCISSLSRPRSVPKHLMAFVWSYFPPTGCNIQIRFWTSNSSIVGIQVLSLSSSSSFSVLSFWLAFSLSFAESMTNVNVTSFQGFLIRFRLSVRKDSITILVASWCVA